MQLVALGIGRPPARSPALQAAQTSVLRIVCAIGLTDAVLNALVTVAGRRTAFGLIAAGAWVVLWWLLLARADRASEWLGRRPLSLVVMAVVGMAPVAVDGGLEGTLTTQAIWFTWVAAMIISARLTLLAAGAMSTAVTAALAASGMSAHELLAGPDRFQVALLVCAPLLAALVALAVVGVFRDVLRGAGAALADLRTGAPASTSRLTQLIRQDRAPLLELGRAEPVRAPVAQLTEAESEVVALLREGRTPQQIALDRGRSLHTVRTQIKRAKRKVGARTINELIARTWPRS